MAKLNQIIAVEKGIKANRYSELTTLHKALQKPDLFNGFQKTYLPKDDADMDVLPPEKKRVQFNVDDVLRTVERASSEMINIEARKDYTNCVAKADVKIGDKVIFKDAPTTFLLFMEKQMSDLTALATELPILDEGESWEKDVNSGLYKAAETKTHRTKKVQKPIVMYDATEHHPAQTQMITEDIIAGFWTQVKQSGAMPKPEKEKLLARIDVMKNAIKQARESANMVEEVKLELPSTALFDYLNGE